MANLTFHQVNATDSQVKTFNVNGTLWDVDVNLIEFVRRKQPHLSDAEIFTKLWTEGGEKFVLPLLHIVLWSTLFGLMVLASLIGNLVVIWTIATDKRMRNVTTFFLLNLSISDVTRSAFVTMFSFIFLLTQEWHAGGIMCQITQYMAVVSVSCSALTLMAISVERYFAIVQPLRKRPSKSTTLISVTILWISSLLIALPQAVYSKHVRLDHADRTVCMLEWPDGSFFGSSLEFAYNSAITILTYFLPLSVMSFAYIRAGSKLWGNKCIGEPTEQQMRKVCSRRKVVKMLIVTVTTFFTCWLPYHAYFLACWLYPKINYWEHIQQVYLATFWLAMSSSMHSPFIYCMMNPRFRSGFRKVFDDVLCCCCSKLRNNGSKTNSSNLKAQSTQNGKSPNMVNMFFAELNGRTLLFQRERDANIPESTLQLK